MMANITRVVGSVDPEAARWAAALSDPAGGRIAIIVPPALPSLPALLGEVLGALGKPADINPYRTPGVDVHELTRAWLLAHRIDRLILVHADWLTERIAQEVSAFAALADLELVCTVSGGGAEDPFLPWASREQSWFAFVEEETRDEPRRTRMAADPARSQAHPIPALGAPTGAHRVTPSTEVGPSLAAYLELGGRIRRDGHTAGAIAQALVQVLRRFASAELPAAAAGSAAALERAGWELRFDRATDPVLGPGSGALWADLRAGIYPNNAAIVGLLASGLTGPQIALLRVEDVALDGAVVHTDGVSNETPPGARPYLIAQRHLADAEGAPFITLRSKSLNPRAVLVTAMAVLANVGITVSIDQLAGPRVASERWLASRSLMLRRTAPTGEPLRRARRCGHGLPGELMITGILMSHSQSLCRSPGPAESRPMVVRPAEAGFRLQQLERTELGVRIRVTRDDRPAGELVGLAADTGPIWLQVGTGRAPALADIVLAIAGDYSVALSPQARASVPVGP